MSDYSTPANHDTVANLIETLSANNITAIFAKTREEAKQKVLELIPNGSEVMTMTSVTVDQLGLSDEINGSGNYVGLKPKLYALDSKTQGKEMKIIGAVHDYVLGSVHAVTEKGQFVVASMTGSQIPAYAYTAENVIWVVGTQKIVKDLDQAFDRIETHTLPLESKRAHEAYGVPGSSINKLYILNKEAFPGRTTVVFIDENIGY